MSQPDYWIMPDDFIQISGIWGGNSEALSYTAIKNQYQQSAAPIQNQLLFSAIRTGRPKEVQLFLEMGADPNTQELTPPHLSLLDVALQAHTVHMECAKLIIDAEGWCSNKYLELGELQKQAQSSETKSQQILVQNTFSELLQTASPSLLRHACAVWSKNQRAHITEPQILEALIKKDLYAKAMDFHDPQKQRLTPSSRAHLAQFLVNANEHYAPLDPALAFLQIYAKEMSLRNIQDLYLNALQRDQGTLLLGLLKSGVCPGSTWSVPTTMGAGYSREEISISILQLALLNKGKVCSTILLNVPPALASARQNIPHPKSFIDTPLSDLLELESLGIAIDGVDDSGKNLLHHWALADRFSTRAGWATLARKYPHLLEQTDQSGLTPVAQQIENLSKSYQASELITKFRKSLSRVEAQGMTRELSRPSKTNKTKPSRSL